jgi:hypothetical protein
MVARGVSSRAPRAHYSPDRKGEVNGPMNEREFPHLVELELLAGDSRRQNLVQ